MAGNIKGITIQIGADTTKLSSALRSADSAIKSTQKSLSEVNRALKFDPGNTDLLRDKQQLLADKISETKDRLAALQQAQDQLDASGVDKNSAEYKELQTEIDTTKSKLSGLNDEMDDFGSVGVQKIAAMGTKVQEVGDKISKVGAGMTAGVTAPITAAAGASVAAWKEVDEAMDTIVTKTGASGEALEDMQNRAQNIATTIPTDFQTAGDAIGEVNTRFGLTGDALEKLSTQFVEFATINDTDVSTAVDSTQAAMAAFGVSADDAGVFLDTLNKAGQDTGVSVTALADDMTKNGAALQEMGMNASDSAMFLANLSKSGVDSSTAMTGLKAALKNATADGTTMQDSLKGLNEVMNSNASDTEKMQAAVEVFGSKAGPILGKAMIDGKLNLDALGTSMQDFAGNTEDAFNATLDPADQLTVAMNNLKATGAQLFTTIQSMATPVLNALVDKMKELNNWFKNLSPAQQEMIIKIAAIAAAIGPLLTIVGKVISVVGTLMTMAPALSGALTALSGPIGIVIAVAGAAVAAGILLYKNWDTIKAKAAELGSAIADKWNTLKENTAAAFENIKTAISDKWDEITTKISNSQIGQAVGKVWDAAKQTVQDNLDAIRQAYDSHGGGMEGAVAAVGEVIKQQYTTTYDFLNNLTNGKFGEMLSTVKDKMSSIGDAIKSAWEAAEKTVSTILSAIQSTISSIWTAIQNTIKTILTAIQTAVQTIWTAIQSTTTTIFNAISSVATSVWNAIKNTITTIATAIQTAVQAAWTTMQNATTSIFNAIRSVATSVWNGIRSTITSVVNGIRSTIQSVWSAIQSFLSSTWNAIRSTASSVWNAIKTAITTPVQSARSVLSGIVSGIKGLFNFGGLAGSVRAAFNAVADAITAPIRAAYNAVSSIVSGIISAVSRASSARASLNSGGGGRTRRNAVAMHQPYLFTQPTVFEAGEAGDEIIYGRSNLLRDIKRAVGDGDRVSYEINMTINESQGQSTQELVREISTRLNREVERKKAAFA